ncbi:MAG: hypothetical protein EXR63_03385 [Dehalococcoidia bacterium]|nr:hypothetical protein [Dehalococcoidia bacterium]
MAIGGVWWLFTHVDPAAVLAVALGAVAPLAATIWLVGRYWRWWGVVVAVASGALGAALPFLDQGDPGGWGAPKWAAALFAALFLVVPGFFVGTAVGATVDLLRAIVRMTLRLFGLALYAVEALVGLAGSFLSSVRSFKDRVAGL